VALLFQGCDETVPFWLAGALVARTWYKGVNLKREVVLANFQIDHWDQDGHRTSIPDPDQCAKC